MWAAREIQFEYVEFQEFLGICAMSSRLRKEAREKDEKLHYVGGGFKLGK